ncbi:DUF4198 domain-containing protein [Sediminibacterium soli]|uniref:DUF4198 domain-containing protein n=1 Tax=Sediminibacterium soli TaxID=2698829 RepID=UPI0013798E25|nr:DUF4198 domain-containing protein [Sediminibacterium soli]NCI47946.1 DUF4198 domain-containing protein [Sediminibacterium soli]
MKRPILLLIGMHALMAFGQEGWLSPGKFFFRIRDVATIRFRAGDPFSAQNWNGNREDIHRLAHCGPSGGFVDMAAAVSAAKGDSVRLPLSEEGTHMVVFNSTSRFRALSADSFNTYLAAAGLETILAYRRAHNETDKTGSGYLQQSSKTIFQVGGQVTDACLRPSLLPLDIVPETNPYIIPVGTDRTKPIRLRFQLLFLGNPVDDALVKTWYLDSAGRTRMDAARTGKRGWVTLTRHPGPCVVNCVYMQRLEGGQAQWQLYQASLSFEFSRFFPGNSAIYTREH